MQFQSYAKYIFSRKRDKQVNRKNKIKYDNKFTHCFAEVLEQLKQTE